MINRATTNVTVTVNTGWASTNVVDYVDNFSSFTTGGDSRDAIAKEALAWENAWNQLEPAWSPTTTNTLAAFKTLRGQCVTLNDTYTGAHTKWVASAETMNHLAATLEGDSVAWYGEATRVFAAGTAEGDIIRRTVPTTYTPPPPGKQPPPATPK